MSIHLKTHWLLMKRKREAFGDVIMARAFQFEAENTEKRRGLKAVVIRMGFAAMLTYSRVVQFSFVMTGNSAIWLDGSEKKKESCQREMYIFVLAQHGKDTAWTWTSQSRVKRLRA